VSERPFFGPLLTIHHSTRCPAHPSFPGDGDAGILQPLVAMDRAIDTRPKRRKHLIALGCVGGGALLLVIVGASSFAYHAAISPLLFAAALLNTLLELALTVSRQAFRTGVPGPVKYCSTGK